MNPGKESAPYLFTGRISMTLATILNHHSHTPIQAGAMLRIPQNRRVEYMVFVDSGKNQTGN